MKIRLVIVSFLVLVGSTYMLVKCCNMWKRTENDIHESCTGGGDDGLGEMTPDSHSRTNEVAEIESDIRQANKALGFKGNDARFWGFDVLHRIESIPVYEEQRRLANAYLDAMEGLRPLDSPPEKISLSLYNMVLLWPTFTAVQSRVDDPERPFRLICKTLLYYRLAIRALSTNRSECETGKASRAQQGKIRQLKSELETVGKIALNVHLRSAERCNLSNDRHAYWKKRVETIMRGDDSCP